MFGATPGRASRYRILVWVAGLFLAINTATRLGLIGLEGDGINALPWHLLPIVVVGLIYDAAAASYLLIPFALTALLLPDRPWGRKAHAVIAAALLLLCVFGWLFTSVAEVLFWNEFAARFNFIAVDYLIYTRETIGNIRQSFPVVPLLVGVLLATVAIFYSIRRKVWMAAVGESGSLPIRLMLTGMILLLPLASFLGVGDRPREVLATTSARELAGNGYYEFARAFRNNDLDYHTFYITMPERAARLEMRDEFQEAQSASVFTEGAHPLERTVAGNGPARRMHVVLVTMESLGADFLQSFGGREGLTPNLDKLASEGLKFTRMYATGTRTVRGLEALSLSIPPTPGHAVLTRKNNKGFQTLGGVLKAEGYDPLFIYGGYSYFDNMQDFFGGNGYTVVDRNSLSKSEISHETVWGVADEDLFKLVVREIDERVAAERKVFAHVMTTSNHRPFTYPPGRIDIPSGSGREGAVKYADWAIGKLMELAAKRAWFKDTLFVFIADHTSHARGRTDLPPENYHIPLIIYAPSLLSAQVIDAVASQIDVGPTILALLNISYTSHFFGQDILTEGQHHQRALMANYLTVGHMEDGILVELSPKQRARVLHSQTGQQLARDDPRRAASINETVAHYQVASDILAGR
jgi:phosphoglycerol transferase MdoB-like AlkP superfamily enzyme